MKLGVLLSVTLASLSLNTAHAAMSRTPWTPLFKGIEHAVGTNFGATIFTNNGVVYTNSRQQSVHCLRVDLSDPDVQLFPTPPATNLVIGSVETKTISISNFVKRYGVQVATVANFYNSVQGSDPSLEDLNCQVFGLSICTGKVVSIPDTGPDSNNRYASLLFTTNKEVSLIISNTPPGTNTDGIYTAVTGYYPVLTNNVILNSVLLNTIYPDPTVHNSQPRTVFGLSDDRRYFYMMIIDGRQPGYSDGANDEEMGLWLLQFGASDGVSMDGGGSAAMYYADCVGNPRPLGHSSYIPLRGRERITGSQLGVFALPLPMFIEDVAASPGTSSTTITWTTESNATSQVEYGLTPGFGSFTPLDPTLVTNHSVTLSGLAVGTRYYYRVLSRVGETQYASTCGQFSFVTTNFGGGLAFTLNSAWKYQTNNLDGVNWQAPGYDDGGWSNGVGALWADTRVNIPNSTNTIPNFASGTRMRPLPGQAQYPMTTYYFRKTFVFSNDPVGVSLIFSNYIDDGAIFYLNGVEIHRTNVMAAPTVVTYASNAISFSFDNATSPILFSVRSNLVSHLQMGTNVVAVEVHNYRSLTTGTPSPDLTFESALIYLLPPPPPIPAFISNVVVNAGETSAAITWTTLSNSTTQIEYGLTPALGSSNQLDTDLVLNHAVLVTDLAPRTQYYFRLVSTVGTNQYSYVGTFTTASFHVPLVAFSNSWRYTTNNLNGQNWSALNYDDSGWLGQGPALLYIENNLAVEPRNTPLPAANGVPFPTYYFRTRFTVTNDPVGLSLVFTNYVDDGAIFYINGVEVQRLRMAAAPQQIFYVDPASECPPNACEATVDVPDIFRVSGDVLTNLVVNGTNVLAAEVHQHGGISSDIVFGSMMGFVRALAGETRLRIAQTGYAVCVSWDGQLLTLQHASDLGGTNTWADVPGPVTSSPYCVTNLATSRFYRLRD
jgi:exopolysaccharide biosynthesis protein